MKALSLADAKRLCLSVPIGLLATLVGVDVANAIGLNEAVQQSLLGEPLRIVIPVIVSDGDAAADDNLSSECAKLIEPGGDRSESDVPQLANGRIWLQRNVQGAQLVVTTNRPINDPVLSVTVQVGCTDSIRRQYTLLLDPPAIDTSVAEGLSPAPVAIPIEPRSEGISISQPLVEPPVHRSSGRSSTLPKSKGSSSHHSSAKKGSGSKVASKAKSSATQAPASKPRLSVSRSAQDTEHGAQPSTADVEVESVVLKRRVEELSAMVQRMQQELEAARAARDAAEAAAPRVPLAATRPSSVRALHGRDVGQEAQGQAYRDLLLFILPMVLLALLIEMWSRRRVKAPLRSAVIAIDLDTAGSTSNHDKVFDNSEATMNPASFPDTEEAPAESAAPTRLASTGRLNAAQAVFKTPLFHYDPDLAFDEEIQSDTIPRPRTPVP